MENNINKTYVPPTDNVAEDLAGELEKLERQEQRATEVISHLVRERSRITADKITIAKKLNETLGNLPVSERAAKVKEYLLKKRAERTAQKAAIAKRTWDNKTPQQREDWVKVTQAGRIAKRLVRCN